LGFKTSHIFVAPQEMRIRPVIIGIGKIGFQPNGFIKIIDSLLILSSPAISQSPIVIGIGVSRL